MFSGRHCLLGLGAAVAAVLALAPVRAGAQGAATAGAGAHGDLAEFEVFLDEHPFVEARLRENPALMNNPAFLRNHPAMVAFASRHPHLAAELAAEPRWFIHRELVRRSAVPVAPAQVAEFDRFLDEHPRIEHQLALHPHLLRNPEFLGRAAELREFLGRHPGLDRAAERRPGMLMRRERRPGR